MAEIDLENIPTLDDIIEEETDETDDPALVSGGDETEVSEVYSDEAKHDAGIETVASPAEPASVIENGARQDEQHDLFAGNTAFDAPHKAAPDNDSGIGDFSPIGEQGDTQADFDDLQAGKGGTGNDGETEIRLYADHSDIDDEMLDNVNTDIITVDETEEELTGTETESALIDYQRDSDAFETGSESIVETGTETGHEAVTAQADTLSDTVADVEPDPEAGLAEGDAEEDTHVAEAALTIDVDNANIPTLEPAQQISMHSLVDDIVRQLMPDLEQQLRFLIQQALEERLPASPLRQNSDDDDIN